jgi:hypothetical protein
VCFDDEMVLEVFSFTRALFLRVQGKNEGETKI